MIKKKLFTLFVLFTFINCNFVLADNSTIKSKQQKVKTARQKKKEDKQYRKQVIKKNKQIIKNYKKYPECKGDENCIKIKRIIYEDSDDFSDITEDKTIKLNVKVLEDYDKIGKKKNNAKNDKVAKVVKGSKENINKKESKKVDKQKKKEQKKAIKKQKQNIRKIEKIEFLDDKRILDLIDEQQQMVVSKKQIKVRTKNKGVPKMCLNKGKNLNQVSLNSNNNAKVSGDKVNNELKKAKDELDRHIEKSLKTNEISEDLIDYIMDNLEYITYTKKKHTEIVNRKNIDYIDSYNIDNIVINKGLKYKEKYANEFEEIENLFSVNQEIILAIWAMETNYGANIGNFNAFKALYSACINAGSLEKLRYFENNIISLAILVDKGYFKKDVKSSFDGGLGGCQFMPDSFYKFAVSLDGGKTDIINKNEDVIASIGNYLHSVGWRYNEGVLTEIEIPNIDPCLIGMNTVKTVEEWKKLGIVPHKNKIGIDYFYDDLAEASIILTDVNHLDSNVKNRRAFLVYDNYKVILGYNSRIDYGLKAGLMFELIRQKSL